MNNENEIERRTRRYWYEDGFAEIGLGVLFGALGLVFRLEASASAGAGRIAVVATLTLLVLLGTLVVRRAIKKSKERVTYPRTGYVAYRRNSPSSRTVLAVLVIVGGTAIALGASAATPGRVLALQSLTLAAALLVPAYRLGLRRFYLLAAVAGVAGCAAVVLGAGEISGSALVFGATGIATLLSGAWTLRSYLGQSGPADEREDPR
jgi:hypothetical protein